MKDGSKKTFILSLVLAGIISIFLLVGLIQLLNRPLFPAIENIKDSFESKHSDQDIMDYVKEKYGLTVSVLENAGALDIKTSSGGYARVMAKNGTAFKVNINVFGAISGDNYHYVKGRSTLARFIGKNEKKPDFLGEVFEDLRVGTDEKKATYYLRIFYNGGLDPMDDRFMKQLFKAYEIAQDWNNHLEKSGDLSFEGLGLEVTYVDEDGERMEFYYLDLEKDSLSLEELERKFVEANEEELYEFYHNKQLEYVKSFSEQYPEGIYLPESPLKCLEFNEIDDCRQFALYFLVSSNMSNYYDDQELREKLTETVQLVKLMDLPIERIFVHGINMPSNIEDQDLSREELEEKYNGSVNATTIDTYEIENFRQLERVEDLRFGK